MQALYVNVGIELLTYFVFGFFWGRLAIPRARDIFGSAKFAYIAFVPLIGYLWFVFAPGRDHPMVLAKTDEERKKAGFFRGEPSLPFFLKGSAPILLGFLFLLAGPLISFADRQFTKEIRGFAASFDANDLENNPDYQPDYALLIKLMGLEAVLASMAEAESETEIEPGFTFRQAVAEGKTLSYIYALEGLGQERMEEVQDVAETIGQTFCENEGLAHVYAAGGTIKLVIWGAQDQELAGKVFDQATCSSGTN